MAEHSHEWTWWAPVAVETTVTHVPARDRTYDTTALQYRMPRTCDCGQVDLVSMSYEDNPEQAARMAEIDAEQEARREKNREYSRRRKERLASQS